MRRFRGVIASASLKRFARGAGLIPRQRFRGVIASASLKRHEIVHRVAVPVVIPRRDCLGLIEATAMRRR